MSFFLNILNVFCFFCCFILQSEGSYTKIIDKGITKAEADKNLISYNSNRGNVTALPLPRFVNLKAKEVNFRKGPGQNHDIVFIFRCRGYPMEVIEEFEQWRMLRDISGITGWVHESLLSKSKIRNALVVNNRGIKNDKPNNHKGKTNYVISYEDKADELLMVRMPDRDAKAIARIEVNTIVKILKCKNDWCKVATHQNLEGWISRENLWGIYDEESL